MAHVLEPESDIETGMEKAARESGLLTLDDIRIIDDAQHPLVEITTKLVKRKTDGLYLISFFFYISNIIITKMEFNRGCLLLAALMLLLRMGYATDYYCSSCSDCTAKIASSATGDVITLTSDITGGDECISFSDRAGLLFDCSGHRITGTAHNGKGIQIGYGGNITVKNCTINSFYHGIYAHDSDNNTFTGNVLGDNNVGIYLSNAPHSRAEGNTVTESVYGGMFIGQGSVYSSISGNRIVSSSVYSYGIDVYMSDNAMLSSNIISSRQYGVKITSSSHVLMNGNTACGHGAYDFFVYLSTDDSGDYNTCTNPGGGMDTGTTGMQVSMF